MRKDGRIANQVRPIRLVPDYTKNPLGSVLIEMGQTIVLCTVNVEDMVPHWMRSQRLHRGWLTAEYSMLPGSTDTRCKRERNHLGGRTQEIQRLIGRSLRGVVDLTKCPEMTLVVDCDVLQADGGTRTAAITGSWVALKLAVDRLLRSGRLKQNPIMDSVAGLSVGKRNDELLLDLDYSEDNGADLDMNVVMTQGGKILELQGTAEKSGFTAEEVQSVLSLTTEGLQSVFELQLAAAEGQEIEG